MTQAALERIGALYAIGAEIRGKPPDERQQVRQARAQPLLASLETWLRTTLAMLSRKSDTAQAILYALNRWNSFVRYMDDGRIEIDNSAAERALRGVALGRSNDLFAGADAGGQRAAAIYLDRYGQAQWRGAAVLPAACARAHCRAPDQPHRRAAALECGKPAAGHRAHRIKRFSRQQRSSADAHDAGMLCGGHGGSSQIVAGDTLALSRCHLQTGLSRRLLATNGNFWVGIWAAVVDPERPRRRWSSALITRYGCLGRVNKPFLLRSENGLGFTSRSDTALVKSYGLQQEFITPYSPEQNTMVERGILPLKDPCVRRQRFESLQHASRVIDDWIGFYNHQRPHQSLGIKTPAEAYALAA